MSGGELFPDIVAADFGVHHTDDHGAAIAIGLAIGFLFGPDVFARGGVHHPPTID